MKWEIITFDQWNFTPIRLEHPAFRMTFAPIKLWCYSVACACKNDRPEQFLAFYTPKTDTCSDTCRSEMMHLSAAMDKFHPNPLIRHI